MVKTKHSVGVLEKCLTGIKGLDEITRGGLPKGRPTLICGSAGSGKTVSHAGRHRLQRTRGLYDLRGDAGGSREKLHLARF